MAENHHRDWKAAPLDPAGASGWRRFLLACRMPAILFLIVTGFYWKLTLTRQYTWLDNPDGVYQVLPWFQFQARSLHEGHLPLWDPHEWGGQPLLGQVQPGTAYPLNWLLFSLPLRRGFIAHGFLQWYFVVIHFLAALFAYLLCRDLNRSRASSVFAGAAFALAGWMGTTDWPQMLSGASWTPLVFLFLFRVGRGQRPMASAALAGTFLGVAFLAGHHQIPIYVGIAATGYWLYLFLRDGRPNWLMTRGFLIFGLVCFLVGALQSIPAWECGKLSVRWVGTPEPVTWDQPVPYDIQTGFGLFPLSVLGIVVPGIGRNANPYLGIALLSMAFIGVAVAWSERTVRALGTLAVAGLVFSLAGYANLHGFLYGLVPMIDKARNPSMAIFIFHFAIIILTAYGIDAYISGSAVSWFPRLWRALLVFAAVLYVALLFRTLWSIQGGLDGDAIAMAALTSLMMAGVLYAGARNQITPRTAYTVIFLLAILETGLFSGAGWRNRDSPNFFLKKIYQDADLAAFLQQQTQPVRVEIDSAQVPYNFGDWYGIDVFGGYLASLTTNVYRVQGSYQGRMLAGTNFFIGDKPIRQNQVEVYANRKGIKIYSNPEAFPRVWTVHHAEKIATVAEIGLRLDRPLSELRSTTFLLAEPPSLQPCNAEDQVQLISRYPGAATIDAGMQCKGMVVLGETAYPGWEASVDGRAARIYEAYGFLRGIAVDAGRHRIELRYRPKTVLTGGILSACGMVVAVLMALGAGRFPGRLKL